MADISDIVLIYLEDSPVSFARVESILPDAKKGWYNIKLLMLQVPLQVVSWILKGEYINGDEFHMNGKKMRMEKVECPIEEISFEKKGPASNKKTSKPPKETREAEGAGEAKIISLNAFRKKPSSPDPEAG